MRPRTRTGRPAMVAARRSAGAPDRRSSRAPLWRPAAGAPDRRISPSVSFRLCTSQASGAPSLTPPPSLAPATRMSPGEEHEDRPPLNASRHGCHHTPPPAAVARPASSAAPPGQVGAGGGSGPFTLARASLFPSAAHSAAAQGGMRSAVELIGGHEVGGGAETREEETPQGSSSADTRCVLSPERPAGTSRCRGCHSHLSRGSHLAGWGRGRTSAESPLARVEAGPSYSSCPISPVAPPRDPPH